MRRLVALPVALSLSLLGLPAVAAPADDAAPAPSSGEAATAAPEVKPDEKIETPDAPAGEATSDSPEDADREQAAEAFRKGGDRYELGNAFGHIALEVDDAYATCEEVKRRGGRVTREAGPMKHGTTVIAFVEDPDGYKIEFIQKKATA